MLSVCRRLALPSTPPDLLEVAWVRLAGLVFRLLWVLKASTDCLSCIV